MVTLNVGAYTLKPFNLEAKESMDYYLSFVKQELSDYTFAANYIWLANTSGFYSIVNDTFCIFILNGNELSMLLPPLGKKENINDAIVQCFQIMNTNNSHPVYSKIDYVCESLLEDFVDFLEDGTLMFEILQDYIVEKKLVDYVYLSEDLINLKGNAYHSKRNEINKFKKVYPDNETEIFDVHQHSVDVMDVFNRWVSHRLKYIPNAEVDTFLDGINFEKQAIKTILKHYEKLDLVGIVLKIDGKAAGFTFGEKLSDNTASILIEKTDFEILGSAQFIFREFCKVLYDKYGCEYINIGDDMGFENLKKVKMSYRPSKLIPKYTIYQKQ